MNFLCQLGFHDWAYLDQRTNYEAMHKVYKRICLKCGKKQDTLTPYLEECEAAEKLESERKKQAIAMWK